MRQLGRKDQVMKNQDGQRAMTERLPKLLTSSQVAKALGVNASTLSRWRARGVGPRVYWLSPVCPRYRETDVVDWLERNAA